MFTAPQPTDTPLQGHLGYLPEGRRGVMQTLRLMRRFVREGRTDVKVRQAAATAAFMVPEKDAFAEAQAIFEYVRDHIRYLGNVTDVETLTTADRTLMLRYGDCDDQTVLLCAMLESVSYPTRFVVAGYNDPNVFEHVYCQVQANGIWVSCDPTEPNAFGWEAPDAVVTFIEGT